MSQSIASDRISESTVARIAGNVASAMWRDEMYRGQPWRLAEDAVEIARAIVSITNARKESQHQERDKDLRDHTLVP